MASQRKNHGEDGKAEDLQQMMQSRVCGNLLNTAMDLLGGGTRSEKWLLGTLMAPASGGGEQGGFAKKPTCPKPSAGGPSTSRPIVHAILDKDMTQWMMEIGMTTWRRRRTWDFSRDRYHI
jgi:hypothetical protein